MIFLGENEIEIKMRRDNKNEDDEWELTEWQGKKNEWW